MKKLLTIPLILIIGFCYGQETLSNIAELRKDLKWDSSAAKVDTTQGFLLSVDEYGNYRILKLIKVDSIIFLQAKINNYSGVFSSVTVGTKYFIPPIPYCYDSITEYTIKPNEHFITEEKWCYVFTYGKL